MIGCQRDEVYDKPSTGILIVESGGECMSIRCKIILASLYVWKKLDDALKLFCIWNKDIKM